MARFLRFGGVALGVGESLGEEGFRVARFDVAALAFAGALAVQLCGCAIGIPLTKPAAVDEQARRSATLVLGKSTRDEVRAALGTPWRESRAWGFDVFRAEGVRREIEFVSLLTPPVPMGISRTQVGGFVLAAYDETGVLVEAATGNLSDGDSSGLMLRAGGLTLGVETVERRGPQLLAEASAFAGYLSARRASADCTLVLACEPTAYQRWPDEGCPDRVAVDAGPPHNLRGLFAWCEDGECPAENLGRAGYVRVPLALPISLAPGRHELTLSSSTFKGLVNHPFECRAGDVQYAVVRGRVKWHWWGPRTSTLTTSIAFSPGAPESLRAHRIVLLRGDAWLIDPELPLGEPEPSPPRE